MRQSARLLDGYDAVAPVAVLYDNAARRKRLGNIEPICTALAAKNVPFTVIVAGDDWLDYRLDPGRLDRFKAVIVAADFDRSAMDEGQKKLLEVVRSAGRLVVWPDEARLAQLLPAPIALEGTEQVGAVPRVAGDAAAPAVVHLLNRRYDGAKDSLVAQENFTLRLRRDLFPEKKIARAVLHAPMEEPRTLEIAVDGAFLAIKVPRLALWAIIELQ